MKTLEKEADIRQLAFEALDLVEEGRVAFVWNHAGTHYATIARALLAALDERDALLADLPHAVGRCGCRPHTQWASDVLNGATRTWSYQTWPEEHTAAISRLKNRTR